MKVSLAQKAKSGFKWTTISHVTIATTQGINLFLLSKFLTPSEFGIISILLVILGFAQLLIDTGFSNAIIYKQNISNEQLSTLYWLNILVGLLIFTMVNIGAETIESFFKLKNLAEYIKDLSIIFLVIPIGQQFLILLQKNLEFKSIAKVDLISYLTALLLFILLLLHFKLRVYAFIYSIIYLFFIKNMLLLIYGLKLYKPILKLDIFSVKFFLKASVYQLGERIINYFNANVDTILVAKLLDQHSLGIYGLSKELVLRPLMVINPIVTKVVFPLMSKYQSKDRVLANIYLKTINNISWITFSLYWIIFFSGDLILKILGDQWKDASYILKILSLYAMIRSIGNPVGSLIMAKGRFSLGFYWNLLLFFLLPVIIFIGSFNNLQGIVLSLLIFQLVLFFIAWKVLIYNLCRLRLYLYIKVLIKNLLITFSIILIINKLFQEVLKWII